MTQITIYLPDDLKVSLRRLAEEEGRSVADIIEEVVRIMVARRKSPRPRVPLTEKGLGDPRIAERVGEHLERFGGL